MSTLLVKNADLVITMDDKCRQIRGGGLFVRNNLIEQVGPTDELPAEADEIVDATGMAILPGLICRNINFEHLHGSTSLQHRKRARSCTRHGFASLFRTSPPHVGHRERPKCGEVLSGSMSPDTSFRRASQPSAAAPQRAMYALRTKQTACRKVLASAASSVLRSLLVGGTRTRCVLRRAPKGGWPMGLRCGQASQRQSRLRKA